MPEDAISGTIVRCIMRSFLTFSKDYGANSCDVL